MKAELFNRVSQHQLGAHHEVFKIIIEQRALDRQIKEKGIEYNIPAQIDLIEGEGEPLEKMTRDKPFFVAEYAKGSITSNEFEAKLKSTRESLKILAEREERIKKIKDEPLYRLTLSWWDLYRQSLDLYISLWPQSHKKPAQIAGK